MVSEVTQDDLEPVAHRIVGDEELAERREGFSMFEHVPKGKHANIHSAAKSWNLKRSTRGGSGGSFERRLRNKSSYLHTGAFGAAAGAVIAMVKSRQQG